MEHIIRQYSLESGALEAQYIEEYFTEFRKKKTVEEIITRLKDREHLILMSMAEDDDGTLIPVAYKIGLYSWESALKAQHDNLGDLHMAPFTARHPSFEARIGALSQIKDLPESGATLKKRFLKNTAI